jgi:hypothetical protein
MIRRDRFGRLVEIGKRHFVMVAIAILCGVGLIAVLGAVA